MPRGKNLTEKNIKQLYKKLNDENYYFKLPNEDGSYDYIPKLYQIAEEMNCTVHTVQYHANDDYRKDRLEYARKYKKTPQGRRSIQESKEKYKNDPMIKKYNQEHAREYNSSPEVKKRTNKAVKRYQKRHYIHIARGFKALGNMLKHAEN